MRGLIQPRVVSFIDFVPMLRALLQLTAPRQIVASMHNNLKALVESSNSDRIERMYVRVRNTFAIIIRGIIFRGSKSHGIRGKKIDSH